MEAEVASEGRAYGGRNSALATQAEVKAQLHCAIGDIDKAIEALLRSGETKNSACVKELLSARKILKSFFN